MPHVIIARKNTQYFNSEKELAGKTIALEKSFGNVENIRKRYPGINIREYPNTSLALDAVSRGKVDAYIGNRAVADYIIKHEVMHNLEIQGRSTLKGSTLSIGVRKDWPILRDILQKALDDITELERNQILSEWLAEIEQKEYSAILTDEEKSWLKKHPVIRVAVDPDWAPIEFIDEEGKLDGISREYLDLLEKHLNIKFEIANQLTWQEAVYAVKNRKLDMFSSVSVTDERKTYCTFTSPYLSFPIKMFSHADHPYVGELSNLTTETVVVVQGYAIEAWLRRDYPHLKIITVPTPLDGLQKISHREATVFIGNVITANYYLGKANITNVRVSGDTPYSNDQAMAVRNDWSVLAGILQKSLNSIPREQRKLIYNRWNTIKFEHAIDYGLIWRIVIVTIIIIFIIIYWNRRLAREINRREKIEVKLRDYQLTLEEKVEQRTRDYVQLAHYDVLTGLPNRILFTDRLTQAMHTADRYNSRVAILFIDLDDFKQVNDSFDHTYGDDALKAVADRFMALIRKEDTLARMGGDEFTLILNNIQHNDDIALIANKIIQQLHEPIVIHGHRIFLGASIGISIYPEHGETIEDLVRNADSAMYKAKSSGRNTFKYYSEDLTQFALQRIKMESWLHKAIENKQFVLHYQPQIDLDSGEICGIEALIRWEHPEEGNISPAQFIPQAERSRLIIPIGKWVLTEACRQMKHWRQTGCIGDNVTMSVNLSALQFEQDDLIDMVKSALDHANLKHSMLELEITESVMMNNPERSREILNQLRDLNVKIAIDDFGTGYSSLSYLKLLPLTKLKIDRAFVSDIPDDPNDVAISRAIISLAESMSLEVLAEGVETEAQHDFLKQEGCHSGQGYLYSKPLSTAEFEQFIASYHDAFGT